MGRYGRLLSRGAPAGSLLNGEWLRVDADLVAHPRYVRRDVPELHLFYTGSAWRIVRGSDDPSGELLAEAVSAALHPATVGVSGWSLLEAETGAVRHCPEYEMVCDGPNTELQPFLMEELGRDFFLRVQLTRKVVWFVCPATGNVYHSAAKPGGPGGRSRPGKRYCHLCAKCFSANNFQSQHLANLHRPGRPTALVTVPDEAGGVHLLWRPPVDPTGQGPGITGYRVRVSVNDGISWQVGINDTGTSEARAIITNLVAAVPYRFQVAAVNCAGVGADSEPSPQLCVAPEHPPTPPPVASRMSDGLDLLSLAAANRRNDAAPGCTATETKVVRALSEGHCPASLEPLRHLSPARSFDVF